MKNHFNVEAWVMWVLVAFPIVVAFVGILILPHLK